MNVKNYLKENTLNCLLKGEIIDFNYFYSQYLKFKKLGNEIFKDNKINKITVIDNEVKIPINFASKNIYSNNIIKWEENLYIKKNIDEHINLAIFSHKLTKALKKKLDEGTISSNFEKEISDIIEIYINNKNSLEYKDVISELPIIIQKFGIANNYVNDIDEILLYRDDLLRNYLNFANIFSLFFHYLKIEIVFYTHKSLYNSKPSKTCTICHKPHYSNVSLCKTCNDKRINEIRSANAKCKRRRDKLKEYIVQYNDVISPELIKKVKEILKKEHTHLDLQKLDLLKKEIEKELK